MKRFISLLLLVLLLVTTVSTVFACENPPKPTCPNGYETIQEAELIGEVVTEGRYGFWKLWRGWIWRDWREVDTCQEGWTWRDNDLIYWECRTVDNRHWTEPVCELIPTPTPEPVGEWCARCSNIFEGWVEWYDRDGGCDDDWYNQRTEYPGDERCVVVTETPVPTETEEPTPTEDPTQVPTEDPTQVPTEDPTQVPTEYPVPTETEEPLELTPTPEPPQCVWQQYWLRDTAGHMCYIIRDFGNYSAGELPAPYTDKVYRNQFCSKDCKGNPVPWNGQLDEWGTTCAVCDEACE